MAIKQNCYAILSDVRIALSEYSSSLVNGTDTTGAFPNFYLINKINEAQQYIWNLLFPDFPEYFLKSASLTITSSVGTLPVDLHKIKRIEDSNGNKINPISVDSKHSNIQTGSQYLYYRYGNTIKLDESDVSGTYTIWYYSRCIDLTTGMSSAGASKSITLATTARKEADYYNGVTIENVTADWVDTISDYSAARVCTLAAETAAASQYYGTVSTLPELFHHLITERATILVKAHPKAVMKITALDLQLFNDNMNETLRSFAGTFQGDVTPDDIFSVFDPIL